MNEDSLEYCRQQVERHYALVLAIDAPRGQMNEAELRTCREYYYWRYRLLEREWQDKAKEMAFVQDGLSRFDVLLGDA